MSQQDNSQFEQRVGRIELFIRDLERSSDPVARAAARELVAAILELHGGGLERMMELVAGAGEPGRALAESFARDERIAALLLLHGLHPAGVQERVAQALEKLGPYLRSHGASVELREVADGTIRIRLSGNGCCCPSTEKSLRQAIERALDEAAPDATNILIEGTPAPLNGSVLLPVLNGFTPS